MKMRRKVKASTLKEGNEEAEVPTKVFLTNSAAKSGLPTEASVPATIKPSNPVTLDLSKSLELGPAPSLSNAASPISPGFGGMSPGFGSMTPMRKASGGATPKCGPRRVRYCNVLYCTCSRRTGS